MTPRVGDEVVVLVGNQTIKGRVVADKNELLFLAGSDGKKTVIINKRQMGAIVMEGAPQEKPVKPESVPQTDCITVLACSNQVIGCKGVRYCKAGVGASRNDFEAFMSKCPKRQPNCKATHLGKLSTVPATELKNMFDSTMYGEYPNA